MTLRFKWYKLSLPTGLPSLVAALLMAPLTSEAECGFRSRPSDELGTCIRFAWRSTVSAMAFDEDGNPTTEAVSTVNFVDLKFFTRGSSTFLRVDNPGKSVRTLMNELGRIAGYGFSILPILFSDAEPPPFFAEFDQIRLVGLKLINVVFDRHVVGRVELASKEGIDLQAVWDTTGKTYVVDTAVYEVMARMIRGQLSFSKGGLVKVTDRLAPQFLHLFEEAIEEMTDCSPKAGRSDFGT
ncbi:hypothetical protein [Paraburkholderia sediminicola]|uniref:hypothetical protein n=1 Tax=Paraburkholderia sediminicola TaxID=458836 RepID=UPI0038B755F9